MSLDDLTVGEFKRLYYEELLTQKEVAFRFGTYQVAIDRFMTRHKLPALGKTGRIERQLPELSVGQRQLIVGSLLGDGHMSASSPRTARISEGHSLKQRGYTDWKADLMGPYVSQRYETTKRKDGVVYKAWCYASHTTTHLRPFYDLFYGSGERVFPANLSDLMTPFVLAIWYLDDGSILNKYHPRISYGLGESSLKHALEALGTLGLNAVVHTSAKGQTLCFPGQDGLFFDLVREHIPACMDYKLPQDRIRGRTPSAAKGAARRCELITRLTPESLRQRYEAEMLTDQEIAESVAREYGLPPFHERAVARIRKKWGIASLSEGDRRERKRGESALNLSELSQEELSRLYEIELLSDAQIGKLYGVSKMPIRARRKRYGIVAISKTERKLRKDGKGTSEISSADFGDREIPCDAANGLGKGEGRSGKESQS